MDFKDSIKICKQKFKQEKNVKEIMKNDRETNTNTINFYEEKKWIMAHWFKTSRKAQFTEAYLWEPEPTLFLTCKFETEFFQFFPVRICIARDPQPCSNNFNGDVREINDLL